jgi:hypothetical protein
MSPPLHFMWNADRKITACGIELSTEQLAEVAVHLKDVTCAACRAYSPKLTEEQLLRLGAILARFFRNDDPELDWPNREWGPRQFYSGTEHSAFLSLQATVDISDGEWELLYELWG